MQWYLEARQPFVFESVVLSHGWYQLAPFEYGQDQLLSTTMRLNSGKIIRLGLREADRGAVVEVEADLTRMEVQDLLERASWMLGLQQEFEEFYILADQEPGLQHARKRAQGRLLRSPTVFEDVVKTILTTNTSWAGTKRMVSSLVELYGDAVETAAVQDGRKAFPTPESLAAVSAEELGSSARLGYRAPYVHELALAAAEGSLDLESLKKYDGNSEELYGFFLAIRGVGPYAAAHLALLLGHYDRIPVDSWARKLVSEEWYGGDPAGEREVQQQFEAWGKWKALAFWLWDWKFLKKAEDSTQPI